MRKSTHTNPDRYTAGWFRHEEEILAAAREARAAGFDILDAYTPYPVHGMDEAVGLKRSRLTGAALAGGLAGLALAIGLQFWVSLVDWPMNIGGKPLAPLPLFIPVTFELTVLLSGLTTVLAFLVISRLRPLKQGPVFEGVTDARFVLVLRHSDGRDDPNTAHRLMSRHQAVRQLEGVHA
jgi:hypothetical protein